jgi:hypothetical protein
MNIFQDFRVSSFHETLTPGMTPTPAIFLNSGYKSSSNSGCF